MKIYQNNANKGVKRVYDPKRPKVGGFIDDEEESRYTYDDECDYDDEYEHDEDEDDYDDEYEHDKDEYDGDCGHRKKNNYDNNDYDNNEYDKDGLVDVWGNYL